MFFRRTLFILGVCAFAAPISVVVLGRAPGTTRAAGVTSISALSTHVCVVTGVGGVKCWGGNDSGQLGDGTTRQASTPVDVVGLGSGVAAISAGGLHTCALMNDGGVKCWGNNLPGEVGDGQACGPTCVTPADVCQTYDEAEQRCAEPLSGVVQIAAGGFHSCAVTATGGVKCWGRSEWGEVGDGTVGDGDALTLDNIRTTPINVTGLGTGVKAISAGERHTCALTTAGGVKCWGRNNTGQLGDSTMTDSPVPVDVVGLDSGVKAISAGGYHTCALTSIGQVKCWGGNSPVPVDVLGLSGDVVAIDTATAHSCAVMSTGGMQCWGDNYYGQLGDGTVQERLTPVDVRGLTQGAVSAAVGFFFTCALTNAGGVKCWGYTAYGSLGDGRACGRNDFSCPTPVDVTGLGPKLDFLGDVNCDDAVNSVDATLVLQFAAGTIESLASMGRADVNRDGGVNSIDALLILQVQAALLEPTSGGGFCVRAAA
jgi:alpha-tubulin suppressor-like RCC1 family protein